MSDVDTAVTMTNAGWAFMAVAWTVILAAVLLTVGRILGTPAGGKDAAEEE